MDDKYEFKLAPAYCLYNGIAVISQNGAEISFLIENYEDDVLKARIKRAFSNYLDYVLRQEDCDEKFRSMPKVEFKQGDRTILHQFVSRLYGINKDSNSNYSIPDQIENQFNKKKQEAAAVLLLDSILFEARSKNATDIHIEGNLIRLRVNGFLEDYMEINDEKKVELIQRIKLLSCMNSLEKNKSQDGHFVYGEEKPLFVRVSSVAVINKKYENSESVVLRLLDTSRLPLALDYLGFNNKQLLKLKNLIQLKNGLILVGGPTCSGKSTTVASLLIEIIKNNFGRLKIISLEDPPEYIIPGVTQLKINEELGKSYTTSLDYIFRQDPDVIMIGEIRDKESASAAIRAALTGHLVFATIHTGNSGEGVLRLENLGISRKIITSVMKGVIIQQLNYIEDKVNLYADIAIPNEEFQWLVNDEMGEAEIDNYFNHFTNYIDTLSKSILIMGKAKNKKIDLWKGKTYGRKVHKDII